MKKLTEILLFTLVSVLTSMTAFAGEWRTGAVPNEGRWWYENDDGAYASNGWFWLDGNRDGVEECYYFDENGWMLAGTVTPDGYTVNVDGAWTENAMVRTRNVQAVTEMEGEAGMIGITIQVGDRQFEAVLTDHTATQAFIAQMPLTLNMSEMNGNEKYVYLPSALPANAQSIGTIHSGDLMLYGSDCLVLFYEDFRTSFRYTRLGSISNPSGLEEALGRGNVQVTFKLHYYSQPR